LELVSVSQLRPGQIVAKAITNANGGILCPPGFLLTESAIERLKNAGVLSIIIESLEYKGPETQARLRELEKRFEGIDDPILLQLKAAVESRLRILRDSQQ